MTQAKPVLSIFYLSQCPICRREIVGLRTRNTRCPLDFQDVHGEGFDSSILGGSIDDPLVEIHGTTTDGCLFKGSDVFAIAYSLVELEWLAVPLQWPLLSPLFRVLYFGLLDIADD